ncbi:hypothetical protein GLX30_32820 [Streptomyces sp. Tu 2975]|uniref:hypothetical protein n=1 Tax=Streptomyces sp. Tu 2975 TaxID=2676871 RepID=UPI001358F8B5|nr:hypothetical protein [Streptomyces sp. Tu 2975]QIP88008.1 hypothetical protein GLX30_32820 [Streptomyces sp. Tu 2975]
MAAWEFRATHVVPPWGMPAWEAPDVSRPTTPLDPLLPVQLAERRGDWGQIVCANGWSAWVDGRLLVAVPQEPPAVGRPLARTADPRPLLARVAETLARYRRAADDLADGLADGETFHGRTRGLRAGLVVDGEAVWLYDAEHERWVYCDGLGLSTFATSSGPASQAAPPDTAHVNAGGGSGPSASGPTPPEPTQVVSTGSPGPDATQVVDHPEAHDATRVVDRPEGPPDASRVVDHPEPPEATRIVNHPETPEATRVVDHPEGPSGRGGER